jgi:hypothetical protein
MRVSKAVVGCAIVGSVLFGVAGAFAAGMPTGGALRVFVVPGQAQGEGTVVLAGAIGDYGKTHKVNSKGIGEMVLQKGTIQVNLAAMQKKLNASKPMILDTKTCSYVFGATAPVTLFNGTGLYKGISGTVALTETFAGYGPFYKTGAHKGQCNTSNNATPIAQYGSVQGVGTVKFG